jgi:hypothetical protein
MGDLILTAATPSADRDRRRLRRLCGGLSFIKIKIVTKGQVKKVFVTHSVMKCGMAVTSMPMVNEKIWQAEEAIRDCNHRGEFGPKFAALAQSVYWRQDHWNGLKRRINGLLGSEVVEESPHADGTPHASGSEGVVYR